MAAMARGLTAVVRRLYAERRLDGILGLSGSGATSITTAATRSLPVGVLVEIDCIINDSEFGDRAADTLLGMTAAVRT